jgi:hypothetical protein
MPLRTTVGDPIKFTKIRLVDHSSGTQSIDFTREIHGSINEIIEEPRYASYLPNDLYPSSSRPASGTQSFPLNEDLPFLPSAGFASLFYAGRNITEDISRRLWVDFRINFEPKLLGGICYGGYPYLPYYITPEGENSANFGLPREIRLSWDKSDDDGFIDSERAITYQESTSHSGIHFLCTEPVVTDHLYLRLSDFPRILQRISLNQSGLDVAERWGFIIPYLFVFEYKERTRYRPRVPGGLLAAVQVPDNPTDCFFPVGGSSLPRGWAAACPDWTYHFTPPSRMVHNSGASIFGQHRTFAIGSGGPGTFYMKEAFGSGKLREGHEVRLFIEQSEENNRSIAGFRVSYPDWAVNLPQQFRMSARIEVYELDPPEGVSPLADLDPKKNKHAKPIFETRAVTNSTRTLTCRFIRPTMARYFVVVFTCLDQNGGRLILEDVELVQSAHVVIGPRPSRTQLIRSLSFRLIGPDLFNDFAKLGDAGFSLAVEHLVSGERKQVLFAANSLLELLQVGSVRVYSNHRSWGIETEHATMLKGSYSDQESDTYTYGWQRSETGKEVTNPFAPDPSDLHPDINNLSYPDQGQYGFTVIGNQETRTHTVHVAPEKPDANGVEEKIFDVFDDALQELFQISLFSPKDALLNSSDTTIWLPWNETDRTALRSRLKVKGVQNFNLPPYFPAEWQNTKRFANAVELLLRDPNNGSRASDAVRSFIDAYAADKLGIFLVSGLSFGINLGVGLVASGGVSGSASYSFPTVLQSTATGSVGAIVQQAFESGYSYAQHSNHGFNRTKLSTKYNAGEMIRMVSRIPEYDPRKRVHGAEVVWQGRPVDIITGTIPLGITLPATAGNMYRTSDEAIQVHFGNVIGQSLTADVWLDISEEIIRDDY